MCSRAFISSLLAAALAASSVVATAAPLVAVRGDASPGASPGTSPAAGSGSSDDASDEAQSELDRQYDRLIDAEKERTSKTNVTERLVSGAAALVIGLYGYYNDNQGLLVKVVYSATQTAGVIMMSNAIADANEPSLLVLTDRYLARRKTMDLERFKRALVLLEQRRAMAEAKQLAYTSAILTGIYAYDAYRETSQPGLQNVFYFLSFNFALVSMANFYKLATHDFSATTAADDRHPRKSVELAVLPRPALTYHF